MRTKIYCFGDSLVYGFPYLPEASWIETVNVTSDKLCCVNYGVPGATFDEVEDKIKLTCFPATVQYLLVLAGTNDLLMGRPLQYILCNCVSLAKWCEGKNIYLGVVYPFYTAHADFNAKISNLRAKMQQDLRGVPGISLLDLGQIIVDNVGAEGQFFDGVHPTAELYQSIGLAAVPLLEEWVSVGKGVSS